ncbi:ABC transporter ATP-binding protein [Bacteriovoracales bacterium]|nr:ABC transporter ATP-binding protein [Bacteriovoracales bacterium]
MIELKNITKSFRGDFLSKQKVILNNISLKVELGKIYGLLGNNGAGKSTLLKVMMNLTNSDQGKVIFDKDCNKIKDVSYSPEFSNFYPNLSAKEFINFIGNLQGIKKRDIEERSLFWFSKFSLSPFSNLKIKKFSHGMLKKLSFISSVINEPKFIILDEPFSGLDIKSREILKSVLLSFKKRKKGILLTSHLTSDINLIFDEIFYLKNGIILKEDFHLKEEEKSFIFKVKRTKDSTPLSMAQSSNDDELVLEVPEEKKDNFIVEIVHNGWVIEEILPKKRSVNEIINLIEKVD